MKFPIMATLTSTAGWTLVPSDPDLELLGEFAAETRDLLEAAEAGLLSLEQQPDDPETVNTVFRAFHTVKGTAAFLGLTPMSELAHRAETILSRVRDREIRYAGLYADLTLRSLDMEKGLLDLLGRGLAGEPTPKPDGFDLLMLQLSDPEQASGLDGGDATQGAVESVDRPLARADAETGMPLRGALTRSEGARGDGPRSAESSVRVRTDRLDRLIDMVGELVIAQAMVAQDPCTTEPAHFELTGKVTHAGKIVRELQALSMSMRMVPLRATFQKMGRLVRDLALKNGKHLELITGGEETELDRIMVDAVADPLVHMVRNACDHGIELPQERLRIGKPTIGTVRLTAVTRGECVLVQITDDGRGLSRDRLVRKAIEKRLIESDKGMSDSEVFALIFAPGFSTAETITDVSGRGVGMDVVRRNVEALRGRIDIQSTVGRGTTFTISLPLTLAITDGLLLRVGAQRYLIPTGSIVTTFRPTASEYRTVAERGELVLYRGEPIPLYRLARLFQIPDGIDDPRQALVVVIPDGIRHFGLMVDELLGQQQVVAKSLGDALGKVDGVSGGAVLGDGQVGLILDIQQLGQLGRHR